MTVDELRDKRLLLEREIEVAINRFVDDTGIIPTRVETFINKVSLFCGDARYAGTKVHVSAEV